MKRSVDIRSEAMQNGTISLLCFYRSQGRAVHSQVYATGDGLVKSGAWNLQRVWNGKEVFIDCRARYVALSTQLR